MRTIEIEEGLRIRFPGRDAEFETGVEVGIVSHMMASGMPVASKRISRAALEQLRSIGDRLGYRMTCEKLGDDMLEVTVRSAALRPKLHFVS